MSQRYLNLLIVEKRNCRVNVCCARETDNQYIYDALCGERDDSRWYKEKKIITGLIEIATALGRSTQTWDLVLFDGEVVICQSKSDNVLSIPMTTLTVCDFITELYITLGVYHNLFLAIDSDNLRRAIGVACMINESP